MTDNAQFYEAFAPEYAAYYDRLAPAETVHICSERLRKLGLMPVARHNLALDLACGPGAHLRSWRDQGLKIEGLDSSPAMLRRAASKAQHDGLAQVVLYCADLRDATALTPLRQRFDFVAAHFNFFNLFTVAELSTVLTSVAGLLRDRGVFMTDFTCWSPLMETTDAMQLPENVYSNGTWTLLDVSRTPDRRSLQRRWRAGSDEWVETFNPHEIGDVVQSCNAAGLEIVDIGSFPGNFGKYPEMPGLSLDQKLLVARAGSALRKRQGR